MPLLWLRAHAEAIEGLQAEEAFREAEIVAVGAAKMNQRDRDKVLHRWNNSIEGRMKSSKTTKDDISILQRSNTLFRGGIGIGIRLVK
jgi:hypothetical protein